VCHLEFKGYAIVTCSVTLLLVLKNFFNCIGWEFFLSLAWSNTCIVLSWASVNLKWHLSCLCSEELVLFEPSERLSFSLSQTLTVCFELLCCKDFYCLNRSWNILILLSESNAYEILFEPSILCVLFGILKFVIIIQ